MFEPLVDLQKVARTKIKDIVRTYVPELSGSKKCQTISEEFRTKERSHFVKKYRQREKK